MNIGIPKILGNWKIVLLSFFGATIFWFFSALGKNYKYQIEYPIKFMYDLDSLTAIKPLPEFVDIDVSGGGWDLFRELFWFVNPVIIKLDNPVDTRWLTKSEIMPILSDQLKEYRINFLFTDTLFVNIDRKASKLVRLKIDSAQINMDPDYRIISSISILPDTILIYGPTSFLDTLGNDFYVPFHAKDIDDPFDRFVKLGLPDILEIRSEPRKVNVKFDVTRFHTLELKLVAEAYNFPEDSSVYISNPNMIIQFVVQDELREEYFADDFKIVVDYNLINQVDSMAPPIVVFYPDHVIEVETVPKLLSITYEK